MLPGSVVVGEEGVAAEPGRLAAVGGDRRCGWSIPSMGRKISPTGQPGLRDHGGAQSIDAAGGGLAMPALRSRDHAAVAGAELGSGAFMAGDRLHVAAPVPLERMQGRLTSRTAKKLAGRIGGSFYQRCAAHESLTVGRGAAHFALSAAPQSVGSRAGELLFREAGGYSRRADGTQLGDVPSEIDASRCWRRMPGLGRRCGR